MRPWLGFGAALLVGAVVSCAVGWARLTNLEPAPVAVLTASAPAEVLGLRFTLEGVRTLTEVGEVRPAQGAVFVRLDLTEEVLPGALADDAYCSAWLFAGADRWANSHPQGTEVSLGQCHRGVEDEGLTPGMAKPLSFYWEVPDDVSPAEFQLRFSRPETAIAIRP